MNRPKGALNVAEGHPDFITDADIIFNNGRDKKDFVLRTTRDDIGVWKTKHGVPMSPSKTNIGGIQKWVARVDKDFWVFGVDAAKSSDIVAAIKIGMDCYGARAADILRDIYVKNLNIENESCCDRNLLVKENKKLYEDVCKSILQAAKILGVQGQLNFYVFSNNKNPKIPKDDLHSALLAGGADTVASDSHSYKFDVGSNDGKRVFKDLISHLHLGTIKV